MAAHAVDIAAERGNPLKELNKTTDEALPLNETNKLELNACAAQFFFAWKVACAESRLKKAFEKLRTEDTWAASHADMPLFFDPPGGNHAWISGQTSGLSLPDADNFMRPSGLSLPDADNFMRLLGSSD